MTVARDSPQAPTPRPGGRTERVRVATLRATLELLLARGYDELAVADVAAAAGVAATTIYRRWPTKAELAVAALAEFAAAENPMPDTGDLASDLRALLEQVLALLRRADVARLVRTFAAIAPDTSGLEAARTAFWHARFADSADMVSRAIDRGELAADTEPEAVIEMLVGPAYLRLLVTGKPIDAALAAECVRRTVAAYAISKDHT